MHRVTESTLIQGPWRDDAPTGTGKGWRAMWSPAADALHQELLAEWQRSDGWRPSTHSRAVTVVLCNAADVVRQDLPQAEHRAVTEACIAMAVWCDLYAPDAGLAGLAHMLKLRTAARWGS